MSEKAYLRVDTKRKQLVYDFLKLLRPKQWTKNLLVFAAAVFAGKIFEPAAFWTATACFFSFCLMASAVYILNDIVDRDADRVHPKKRERPVASGRVGIPAAGIICVIFFGAALTLARVYLGPDTLYVLCGYSFLNILYMYRLKHVPLLDVAGIAGGFLLRAVAGGIAIEVPLSSWFLLCVIFLSLFLALLKRRNEIVTLAQNASNHRQVLGQYQLFYLDQLTSITATCTILTYALYTVEGTPVPGHEGLVWTVPLVIYGIFRYLYLVYIKGDGGAPEEILLSDIHIVLTVLLYGAAVIYIIMF